MRARKRWHGAVGALFIVVAASDPAGAQNVATPARAQLSVPEPATCLSAGAIARRVRARSQRIELSDRASGVAQLRASARSDGQRGMSAELQIAWPDGRRSERQLAVANCDEAIDALAFLITLTLDPEAAARAPDPRTRNATAPSRAAGARERDSAGRTNPTAREREAAGRTNLTAREREPDGRTGAGRERDAAGQIGATGPESDATKRAARGDDAPGASPDSGARDRDLAAPNGIATLERPPASAREPAAGAASANSATPPVGDRGASPAGASAAEGKRASSSAESVERTLPSPAADSGDDDSRRSEASDSAASERSAFGVDHVQIGLLAQLALGVAPSAMRGFGVRALLAFRGSGWWAPALQLRATRVWRDGWEAPGGTADFRLDAARLDLCPLGVRWQFLVARACLSGAVGNLRAEGSRSFVPRAQSRLWVDGGPALGLGIGLGPRLQIQVNAGLLWPLRRDRYAFLPDVFHRVAAVAFQGDLGVGLRFP